MKKQTNDANFWGFDIGSTSVGWAVCDSEYLLSRRKGKNLWGVRLFDEAQTAAARRTFRIMRRRIDRRNERLAWLQLLFEKEIAAKDPAFFQRMQSARLWPEDKGCQNTLFEDEHYHDRDYHRAYPTIYHLRLALIQGKPINDVRLLYLAIHHILKYRGHFLLGDMGEQQVPSLEQAYADCCAAIEDELEITLTCSDVDRLRLLLLDRQMRQTDKEKALCAITSATTKQQKEWMKALAGGSASLAKLFEDESLGSAEIAKIQFSKPAFEDDLPALEALLGERMYCLEKLRAVYNWAVLQNLLHGCGYLSEAKVQQYEQHARDLRALKTVIRRYGKRTNAGLSSNADYSRMFLAADVPNNYAHYIGCTRVNGKKQSLKTCQQDDLCKLALNILNAYPQEDADVAALVEKARAQTLLPKIVSKDNSVIPFQLQRMELTAILSRAVTTFPFLNEKDENGLSVSDRLLKLLEFRIPYYVGPLNRASPNSWFERREDGRITPWNFDQKVDRLGSAMQFINRMTGQCSYLRGQKVLPHCSPLYQRFMTLNELNPLTICGTPISVELKQQIFSELMCTHKKVTISMLVNYLKAHGMAVTAEDIGGVDIELKSTMRMAISLKGALGSLYSDALGDTVAAALTYFGADRKLLRKYLSEVERLTKEVIDRVVNLHATGWGNLSRAFLCDITCTQSTGEVCNLITALWETNETLMGLLSDRYDFSQAIERYNREHGSEATIEQMIGELYVSPSAKRQIHQTLVLAAELRKVIGHDPQKVFVEMARGGEAEKTRKLSRKRQLVELYRSIKGETRAWMEELEARDEHDFKRDRLYLYYTQMGKCMYTGKPIELNELFNENIYDVDHIYPQSRVKDDSITNRVLVLKTVNEKKSDEYPITAEIRHARQAEWKLLLERKLISQEKYNRLTRTTQFEDYELTGFINRQLVDTRQGSKAVAALLKRMLPDTEIAYVKAGTVSDFRRDRDMLKVREINDLHHAKDAYLNIVVGNVYNTKFTHSPVNFISAHHEKYNLKRMFDFDVARNGVTAWDAGEAGTIGTVRKVMARNSVLVTMMTKVNTGELFDVQPMSKGSGQMPLKRGLPIEKYGGYNKVRAAYFMLVEHTVRKKRVRTIIDIPIHLVEKLRNDPHATLQYCKEVRQMDEPVIILPMIKPRTLMCINGFYMYLAGKTGNQLDANNANQLLLDYEWETYIKRVVKYVTEADEYERLNRGKVYPLIDVDKITAEKNIELYQLFIRKLQGKPYCLFALGGQGENLLGIQERFAALSREAQCRFLREILKLFARAEKSANFSALYENGKNKQAGTIRPNSDVSIYEQAFIIYQSPTGLYEHKVDLKA